MKSSAREMQLLMNIEVIARQLCKLSGTKYEDEISWLKK